MHAMPSSGAAASDLTVGATPSTATPASVPSSLPAAGVPAASIAAPTGSAPVGESGPAPFADRRQSHQGQPATERRQFASSHQGLSAEARELAMAIDRYKLEHRRRYVTFEEMLRVIQELGYHK